MADSYGRILRLIEAIQTLLAEKQEQEGAEMLLRRLKGVELSEARFRAFDAQPPPHGADLDQALANIETGGLAEVARSLKAAKDDLAWAKDDLKYYRPGADVGAGYEATNQHALLIGPGACGFEEADFSMGIFLLGPRTLYRDHRHLAPETYINLSPRTGWRFDGGGWSDFPGGSVIFNPPNQVHATRVYDQPFLSVFAWLNDIDQPCEVVAFDDWPEIEAQLQSIKTKP